MDQSAKETQDFMNVDSFSQLPFIRPAPLKPKAIRLFGFQLGADDAVSPSDEDSSTTTAKEPENADNNRRFECHYCNRNFPTSQALGGHQNAHKRERQHAKRAHLHSAVAHNSLSDSHIYGLLNYTRHTTVPPSTFNYPSWNVTNPPISRFYGAGGHGFSSRQQPIAGNSVGLWRNPSSTVYLERSLNKSPLYSGENFKASPAVGGGSAARERYGFESKARVQGHVSLDLHL